MSKPMLSNTLQDGLNSYEIGPKIRALRLKRKIGLVDVGKHTGLSPALLSKIERGRLFPTLPTLLRVAMVFGVGLEYFFAGAREKPLVAVVRKSERVKLPDRPGAREVSYRFESLDFAASERRFSCYLAEFFPLPLNRLRPHDHAGFEFVYVMAGTLSVHLGDDEQVLGCGDSMYFDSTQPHAYRRSAGRTCTALVVTSAASN